MAAYEQIYVAYVPW